MANGRPRVKKQKSEKIRMKNPEVMIVMAMKEAFYRKMNPRREQEIMDSRMIREDHDAIANLSGRFINKTFDADRFVQSLGRYDEASEVGE